VRPVSPCVQQEGPDVLLTIHVQPRASHNQLVFQPPDRISLRLTAPPVDGAANAACCAFLADRLDRPKSSVIVVRGETSRKKLVRIRNASAHHVLARLQAP